MEHEFSEDFIHDIGYILEQCKNNETDNCDLTFTINGKKLNMEITFSIIEEEVTE